MLRLRLQRVLSRWAFLLGEKPTHFPAQLAMLNILPDTGQFRFVADDMFAIITLQ